MAQQSSRPQRNGECQVCGGKIRHYPPPAGSSLDTAKCWAHLDRDSALTNPHDPVPTEESLISAGVA